MAARNVFSNQLNTSQRRGKSEASARHRQRQRQQQRRRRPTQTDSHTACESLSLLINHPNQRNKICTTTPQRVAAVAPALVHYRCKRSSILRRGRRRWAGCGCGWAADGAAPVPAAAPCVQLSQADGWCRRRSARQWEKEGRCALTLSSCPTCNFLSLCKPLSLWRCAAFPAARRSVRANHDDNHRTVCCLRNCVAR